MCRLLGVLSSDRIDFHLALRGAPRSLAVLSSEHPHGWGVAIHNSGEGWTLQKSAVCARDDVRFHEVAEAHRGEVLIAHIRFRTVGPMSIENTHPFQRGRWVFAHNGTITDLEYLRTHASDFRLSEIEGETDSELFFAFLLSRLDAVGSGEGWAGAATDEALCGAVGELISRPSCGAANFLLSDGNVMYTHRSGRTLYLLQRNAPQQVEPRVLSETITSGEVQWPGPPKGLLIASEQLTDEPWVPIDEGSLLRFDRFPTPSFRVLNIASAKPELSHP